jgi:SAM-dependent methyltransferase
MIGKVISFVNRSLLPIGIKLNRVDSHNWSDVAAFIPFEKTEQAARRAGMSVGDYVDGVLNGVPGSSQNTIDKMASTGVFSKPLKTVLEIGPGSGRYLEKVLKAHRPSKYVIYETARPWADYLVRKYNVELRQTDGYSLQDTADESIDLVQAHKVFSSVPFMVTCCYWHEMARVIEPGGWAAFDILTEDCLAPEAMSVWAKSGIRGGTYPAMVAREVALGFFLVQCFDLVGDFIVPMPPGTTKLLIFRKRRRQPTTNSNERG